MDSPRRARNRAACRRCQRRKIRCDGNTPICGACQKAGVACINDGKQEVHRSYIANMENRIKWLESIVRDKCSNIDLANGPEGQSEVLDESIVQPESPRNATVEISQNNPSLPRIQVQEIQEHLSVANQSVVLSQDPPPSQVPPARPPPEEPHQAHEIGFVSLSPGGDPRYIGPSSGYFFAKRIFSNTGWRGRQRNAAGAAAPHLPVELLNTPASLPPHKEVAVDLSMKYFRSVHLLYPFLHEQAHMAAIERVYGTEGENPMDQFQVYMVLAISSLNLSRQCKMHLPVEGYYASAMKYADDVCHHGSMATLQCLLLLMVYALYNPSCNINIWNLNYQCLASVIDLGLQRDVRASPSNQIFIFDQEMRTRVFWVVYTFDRTVCTMMGRPIGIRDEACEIRFPQNMSDRELINATSQTASTDSASHMSYSIHLFKLAQLNSEIKYVMHSIRRDAPAYAFPPVRDILAWQQDMTRSLHSWVSEVPKQSGGPNHSMEQYCAAKYHETMILLLRPSPGIPNPADEVFDLCFHHAFTLLQCFGDLYGSGNLLYSRLIVHSIFLGTLVMLHCIWKFPATATKLRVDELLTKFNIAQNILSSIGEHWEEATRARDCIAELSSVTIQRLLKNPPLTTATLQQPNSHASHVPPRDVRLNDGAHAVEQSQNGIQHGQTSQSSHMLDPWPSVHQQPAAVPDRSDFSNLFDDLLQGDLQGWSGMSDIDGLMWEIFNTSSST